MQVQECRLRNDSERSHVPSTITSSKTQHCFNISTRKNGAGTIHRAHSVFASFTCSYVCVHVCMCVHSSVQFYHMHTSMGPPPQARYRTVPSQGSLMLPLYNHGPFPLFSLPHSWRCWPRSPSPRFYYF